MDDAINNGMSSRLTFCEVVLTLGALWTQPFRCVLSTAAATGMSYKEEEPDMFARTEVLRNVQTLAGAQYYLLDFLSPFRTKNTKIRIVRGSCPPCCTFPTSTTLHLTELLLLLLWLRGFGT